MQLMAVLLLEPVSSVSLAPQAPMGLHGCGGEK
jgi:hypothetical protein